MPTLNSLTLILKSPCSSPELLKKIVITYFLSANIGQHWIYHSGAINETEEELEKNPESKLWRIVKYCHSKNKAVDGYKLLPNDLVKLGRVRFKVKEISSPSYLKL